MARRQYRSRLARKESKRMMRQSIILFVVTSMIIIGGVFWGIPAIIRMAGVMGEIRSSSEPIQNVEDIPPFSPQLSIPYEATNSAIINISGFGPADTQVTLYNNGDTLGETSANEEGEFVFSQVNLLQGENQFTAIARNRSNQQSDPSRSHTVYFDNRAPEIELEEPEDGQEFFGIAQQNINVRGQLNKSAQVYVNDRLVRLSTDNQFSQEIRLNPGGNQIKVKAIDRAGNETEIQIEVEFSE